ncbi:MAG TPA: MoaD/ThiS family protein [Polyangia bacterium]
MREDRDARLITFHLTGPLRQWADGASEVNLDASPADVRGALAALFALHPGLRDRITNETGAVRVHVNVFVNGEAIKFTGGLSTPLWDRATLHVMPAISGGS